MKSFHSFELKIFCLQMKNWGIFSNSKVLLLLLLLFSLCLLETSYFSLLGTLISHSRYKILKTQDKRCLTRDWRPHDECIDSILRFSSPPFSFSFLFIFSPLLACLNRSSRQKRFMYTHSTVCFAYIQCLVDSSSRKHKQDESRDLNWEINCMLYSRTITMINFHCRTWHLHYLCNVVYKSDYHKLL